jgi:hypothetical protein
MTPTGNSALQTLFAISFTYRKNPRFCEMDPLASLNFQFELEKNALHKQCPKG